jgi:hypothetical protein
MRFSEFFFSIGLIITFAMSGCNANPESNRLTIIAPADTAKMTPTVPPMLDKYSWLESPCGAGCWENITPGKTSSPEALTIVQTDLMISEISKTEISPTLGTIAWRARGVSGKLFFDPTSKRIDYMTLGFFTLTLGEIVDAFGEPDYILINVSEIAEEEGSYSSEISLYWKDFALITSGTDRPDIASLLVTNNVVLFPRDMSLGEVLKFVPSGPVKKDDLIPWTGYKPYDDYLP